jgi:hypothetical protein
MDKVCAVVDIQGFDFGDRFIARELAICSDQLTQCQELNPKLNLKSLTEKDQQTVRHCTKFTHGLNFCPFNPIERAFLPHSNDVGYLLQSYYNMISKPDKPYFAYKNRRLGEILKANNIPCFDLDDPDLNFPPMKQLEKIYGNRYTCGYHRQQSRGFHVPHKCAYRKCNQLWRHLKQCLQDGMLE